MASSQDKILVAGGSGFLGRALCRLPADDLDRVCTVRTHRPNDLEVAAFSMDLTDAAQVEAVISQVRPKWVINAAAETSVDGCETNPERAFEVHVTGTRNLVRACEKTDSGLITVSTNYVFDGRSGPYNEGDCPNPLNVYGKTKLEGEACVLSARCPGIVVRTAVLYGYRAGSRPNFVTWAAGTLARKQPIRVVTDERANPTLVDELADFLLNLTRRPISGLIHFAGREVLSRYEMVEQVCACFGLDLDLVTPVTSAELGQNAERPLQAGLRIDRLREQFNPQLTSFEESLRQLADRVGDPALLLAP